MNRFCFDKCFQTAGLRSRRFYETEILKAQASVKLV